MININDIINKRYKILGTVGHGGMSDVYQAKDLIFKREVAIKVIKYEFINNIENLIRFQNEARISACLNHPNIIKIFDYGEIDNLPFIVNILASGIIGPIFEEVLFRISFINKLEKITSSKLLIIFVSSFIFAISHSNLFSIIIASILGVINSYIFIKRKDAIKICLVHIFINITSSFLYCYNSYILILGIALLIISLLCFLSKK